MKKLEICVFKVVNAFGNMLLTYTTDGGYRGFKISDDKTIPQLVATVKNDVIRLHRENLEAEVSITFPQSRTIVHEKGRCPVYCIPLLEDKEIWEFWDEYKKE